MNFRTIIPAFLLAVALIGLALAYSTLALAQSVTLAPTYDPFAELPLPENPTQLEVGRHTFWHHCMPCHGDVGQGLTDEFRLQWEPDHQNCWARGCHSGRYSYDSFPVPTVVPALAGVGLLTRYTPDSLFEFLRATHPPQEPGLLTDNEYRAIIAFLYDLNAAPFPASTLLPAPSATTMPVPSLTPTPSLLLSKKPNPAFGLLSALGLTVILTVSILITRRVRRG